MIRHPAGGEVHQPGGIEQFRTRLPDQASRAGGRCQERVEDLREVVLARIVHDALTVVEAVDSPDLRAMRAQGRDVLLLPAARERVIQVAGYDPVAAGARAMFADDP